MGTSIYYARLDGVSWNYLWAFLFLVSKIRKNALFDTFYYPVEFHVDHSRSSLLTCYFHYVNKLSVPTDTAGFGCPIFINFFRRYSPGWHFVHWSPIFNSIVDASTLFIILHSMCKDLFGCVISRGSFTDFTVLYLNKIILPRCFFILVITGRMCEFIYTVSCHFCYNLL